ncbi:hypothetical protein [Rubritalea tangerina]|uniref:hypothetical protein n=1 Tax=Rubritalea tangerina TaxID=430798 RepID=UPI003609447F
MSRWGLWTSTAFFVMSRALLAIAMVLSLASCQTIGRTMQVPGNMMQSIGRSAGLAACERDIEGECQVDAESVLRD